MLQRMFRRLRREDGFTLLEVLVVIAILGIIAALITPKFLDTMVNARVDTAMSSGKQIQVALERYNFSKDGYPAAEADYAALVTDIGSYVAMPPATGTGATFAWPTDAAANWGGTSTYKLRLIINNSKLSASTAVTQCLEITPTAVTHVDATAAAKCY